MSTQKSALLNNEGYAKMIEGDYHSAYRLLRQAVADDRDNHMAYNNLASTLKQLGREPEAIAIYERLVAEHPELAMPTNNLAFSRLRHGRYMEGWKLYGMRHHAKKTRLPNNPLTGRPVAKDPLPGLHDLVEKNVLIVPEQGLGDEIFFLRFVPRLRLSVEPASIWYAPSPKAYPLLRRCPELLEYCNLTDMAFSTAPRDNAVAIHLADLPLLLGHDGSWFPPSLNYDPPEPPQEGTLGVTWKAGNAELVHRGSIFKGIPPEALGRALSHVPYRIRVVQRGATADELAAFSRGLDRDFDQFEPPPRIGSELVALLECMGGLEQYVGVSNTNTHLRAMLGRSQHVIVGLPGEWRWPVTHPTSSPWQPQMPVYRYDMQDEWEPALERLTASLQGREPSGR